MIDTEGLLTVDQAAKRLGRSTEQVRRYLREGKLRGRRIGNQWFIDEDALEQFGKPRKGLIPTELLDRIDRSREETFRRNGIIFDVVKELQKARDNI